MAYQRERWDGGVGCFAAEYCRGGDAFLNNDVACTSKALTGGGKEAYRRLARTIAHEIGHVLLQTVEHYTCISNGDNDNLMTAQGENGCSLTTRAGEGYKLFPEQCTKARNTINSLNWLLAD